MRILFDHSTPAPLRHAHTTHVIVEAVEEGSPMRRRDFIRVIVGSAAAWPLAARAQPADRMRRVGVLLPGAADDPVFQTRYGAFLQGLGQSGWTIGHNVRIDTRWATPNVVEIRRHAAELAALAPDVVLAYGNSTMAPWWQATRTVPTVFTAVADPVGEGFVESLARPGGNATGFSVFEWSIAGKWLELLKEIAPSVTRAAVLRDSVVGSGASQFAVIQAVAPLLRMEVSPINVGSAGEIERAITAFARAPNGGLIGAGNPTVRFHRDLIVALAARHKLPAVYFERVFVDAGGLVSYGPNYIEQFRLAAGYVARVLNGEKPADLPVQAPTRYETVLNLKTAKALGINVPTSVLARADEVIEQ
jgi:putative ABC transport system substrate-binding protein